MKDFIVSIGIVALNEEKFINKILDDIYNQTYDRSKIELLLIDGLSTDKTKELMLDFKNKHENDFFGIVVLDNPKKIQSAGWNLAIKNFKGDSLSRIDAHATISPDFVSNVVKRLNEGENIVGGPRGCIIDPVNQWTSTLIQVENSLFGSSINSSRRDTNEKKYVKTMFHATYKREVLESVGLFNENLLRTEDNELHYRMREKGYKFCFCPEINSSQYARMSLKKMLKQKFQNGYWIGKTFKYNYKCLSLFYFVPIAFLLTLLATIVLSFFGIWIPVAVLIGAYLLFAVANTIISAISSRVTIYQFLMPVLFLLLHLSYGAGTLIGLFSINRFEK